MGAIIVLQHDSRVERIATYFLESYNSTKETPTQYFQRLLALPNPWSGFVKTPDLVKQEIWKRTTNLINMKFRRIHEEEMALHYMVHQTGHYTVKSGKHKGKEYVLISGKYIWLGHAPQWFSVADGNPAPFDKKRAQAIPPEIFPVIEHGAWYSLETHQFVSFDREVKKAS